MLAGSGLLYSLILEKGKDQDKPDLVEVILMMLKGVKV